MAGFRGYRVVFEFHAGSRGEVDDQKGDILLKLRKVEIVGFKSFCERTVVTFSGSGTTCIVGPNGCGKSNVVDAISWVLGEQSHKSLRAERMADCIFNGTTKRPPMGLAEVTITLEDPKVADKPVLAMKPGEVVVSRRLYRSGESEYLINGRVGRLRDIQEMFMGVGLGPDSYA